MSEKPVCPPDLLMKSRFRKKFLKSINKNNSLTFECYDVNILKDTLGR